MLIAARLVLLTCVNGSNLYIILTTSFIFFFSGLRVRLCSITKLIHDTEIIITPIALVFFLYILLSFCLVYASSSSTHVFPLLTVVFHVFSHLLLFPLFLDLLCTDYLSQFLYFFSPGWIPSFDVLHHITDTRNWTWTLDATALFAFVCGQTNIKLPEYCAFR